MSLQLCGDPLELSSGGEGVGGAWPPANSQTGKRVQNFAIKRAIGSKPRTVIDIHVILVCVLTYVLTHGLREEPECGQFIGKNVLWRKGWDSNPRIQCLATTVSDMEVRASGKWCIGETRIGILELKISCSIRLPQMRLRSITAMSHELVRGTDYRNFRERSSPRQRPDRTTDIESVNLPLTQRLVGQHLANKAPFRIGVEPIEVPDSCTNPRTIRACGYQSPRQSPIRRRRTKTPSAHDIAGYPRRSVKIIAWDSLRFDHNAPRAQRNAFRHHCNYG